MKYIRHRIDVLHEKAQTGDPEAQYQLARCLYYGNLVERSRTLARYWIIKALENGHPEAPTLYDCIAAPHFTGNEQYTSFAQSYDLMWGYCGIWGSCHFHDKHDAYPKDQRLYRTYLYLRILFLYLPSLRAYRVLEDPPQSYKILGTEKIHWREMIVMPLISLALLILLLILLAFLG